MPRAESPNSVQRVSRLRLFDEQSSSAHHARSIKITSLSKQDEKYIQELPLETSLEIVKSAFTNASKKSIQASSEMVDIASRRDATSNLLLALLGHPVAERLRLTPSQRPVNRKLASVYARVQSDDFDLRPFSRLTTLIADEAQDVEI
jgi:hypothetical protein